jgi:DNA-binding transcriptional LysR family regulator
MAHFRFAEMQGLTLMAFDGRLLSGMSVLAAVVEGGSFTRAGELLGLSPSGVSRSITRLEARIGVRLLDRTTRALHLTDEGARLYELAVPHLAGIEDAANVTSGTAAAVHGALRASVNPVFARQILAPRLPEFIRRYPGLQVTILQHPDVGDLISEGIDVAIRFGPQPPSTMSSRLVLKTRVLTVAAPAYLDRRGRPASPRELPEHDCIQLLDPRTGRPFEWEFVRGSETLPVKTCASLMIADPDTMVAVCVAGGGIAQVLELGMGPLLASAGLIDLFPNWPGETFPLYAVRPSRRLPPAKVEAFIDFCIEICGSSVPVA